MPISKATREARIAAGKCPLCGATKAKGHKYCPYHVRYFRRYREQWRTENGSLLKNKCSFCRKVGHNFAKCDDPEAIALRAELKAESDGEAN